MISVSCWFAMSASIEALLSSVLSAWGVIVCSDVLICMIGFGSLSSTMGGWESVGMKVGVLSPAWGGWASVGVKLGAFVLSVVGLAGVRIWGTSGDLSIGGMKCGGSMFGTVIALSISAKGSFSEKPKAGFNRDKLMV